MQKKTGNAPPEKKWSVSPAGEFPPWRRSTMGGRGAHGAPRGRGGRRGGRGRGRGRGGGRGGASAAADGGAAMGAGSPRTITFRARRGRGRPRAPDMPSLPTQPSNEVRMRRGKRQGDRPLPEHRCRVQAVRKGDVWRHCMRCRWYKDAKRTGIVRKTKAFCASCGVPLCENCFEYWHGGEWMPEGWQSCHGSHSADPGIPVART